MGSTSYATYGESFLLLNFHPYQAPCPGLDIGYVKAMLVPVKLTDGGQELATVNTTYDGTVEASTINISQSTQTINGTAYDVGTPWYPPIIPLTPAQIAAKKWLENSF